jgi:hypothetical protein
MSKKSSDPLTRVSEKRPVAPETGRIVVRPLLVTGPIGLFVVEGPELPPALLERLILIPEAPEAGPCR